MSFDVTSEARGVASEAGLFIEHSVCRSAFAPGERRHAVPTGFNVDEAESLDRVALAPGRHGEHVA